MEDYRNGLITFNEMILYKVYSVNDLSKLPEKYRSGKLPWSGTMIMGEAYLNWEILSLNVKEKIAPYLAKPGTNELRMKTKTGEEIIKFSPIISGFPRVYDTDHFHIHYTTTSSDSNRILHDADDDNGFRDWQKFIIEKIISYKNYGYQHVYIKKEKCLKYE